MILTRSDFGVVSGNDAIFHPRQTIVCPCALRLIKIDFNSLAPLTKRQGKERVQNGETKVM